MKRKLMFQKLIFVVAFSLPLAVAFTENAPIVTDESTLFGDDDSSSSTDGVPAVVSPGSKDDGIDSVGVSETGAAVNKFLKTAAVRVGGSFTPSLEADWLYRNPWDGSFDVSDPDYKTLTPDLPALVFIDARPKEDFRVYFSVKAEWPFINTAATTNTNVQVFELFSDFNLDDKVFFRFGKHTVKWGVGYFFSPADILNLTSIDVTDPTAQREGPVSLRVNVPIPGRQDNVWAYVLVPSSISPSLLVPEDIGFAGKYELVVGGWEIGAGGIYQRAIDPRLVLTASGSFYSVAFFGEAVSVFESDKDSTADKVRFSGTAGFTYMNSDWNFTAIGQYYYNGESTVDSRKQYGALSLSKAELFTDDFTVGVLVLSNLSDLSFMVKPSITWAWLDYASLSFAPVFTFASDSLWGKGKSGEYVSATGGPAMTLSVKAVLGTGKF